MSMNSTVGDLRFRENLLNALGDLARAIREQSAILRDIQKSLPANSGKTRDDPMDGRHMDPGETV